MLDLKFIAANAKFPRGPVTSTARRGKKWNEAVKPGDVVNLIVTESGANIGRAAIITTEVKSFAFACNDAFRDKNHATLPTMTEAQAEAALRADLKAAYGDPANPEDFTVVTFVVLNPEHVGA